MVIKVEIISREMVKPSSPTPHDHLRNLKLSFLDQIAPPVYVPIILFYPADQLGSCESDRVEKYISLKQSLSSCLTQFYPLAGRIKDNISVECDDNGVEYVEARVHAQLSQVIAEPNMEELKEYLPVETCSSGAGTVREMLLAIQINIFDCGGIAIGVCISHRIADGSSLVTFINAWAAKSRGDAKIFHLSFDNTAILFPPRELYGFSPTIGITKEKIVTKKFLFDKSTLTKLKEVASSAVGSEVKDPTRVEVVSAFILKLFMELSKKTMFSAVHAVNLRPKMSPPLSDQSFGNLWWFAFALLKPECAKDFHDLVTHLRNSIRKINGDYVKMLQTETGDEYLKILNGSKELFSKVYKYPLDE